MADYYEDVNFHNNIFSTCSNGPQLTKQGLIDAIYKYDGETWAPEGFTQGSSRAEFVSLYGQNSSQYSNLFLVLLTDSGYDPILATDHGFVVKKDLSVGGFVSSNQGEIWIGHGRNSSTDTPRIALSHSDQGYNKLYLTMADCSTPAHLDVNCLDVHGYIEVGTYADGISRFIIIKGPNDNGQTATLNLIDEYNFVRSTFGGSTMMRGFNDIQLVSGNGAHTATFWGSSGAWNFNSNCGVGGNGAFSTNSAISLGVLGSGSRALYLSNSSGGGTISSYSSSLKYKENIEALQDCSWIYQLRPVTFDWKDEQRKSEGKQWGLIAEEVYNVNPAFVWCDEKGLPDGVKYEHIGVPLLVEMQKLRAEVDDLKTQLETLKKAANAA
jgi:hypothetical protein